MPVELMFRSRGNQLIEIDARDASAHSAHRAIGTLLPPKLAAEGRLRTPRAQPAQHSSISRVSRGVGPVSIFVDVNAPCGAGLAIERDPCRGRRFLPP